MRKENEKSDARMWAISSQTYNSLITIHFKRVKYACFVFISPYWLSKSQKITNGKKKQDQDVMAFVLVRKG